MKSCVYKSFTTLTNSKIGYGTSAQKIYIECCKLFGWDINQKGKFGPQQNLYAETKDKFGNEISVWFIRHSNFTGAYSTKRKAWNNIDTHNDKIEQKFTKQRPLKKYLPPRLIFARDSFNHYIFMGIYERISYDQSTFTEVFKRTSKTYPYKPLCTGGFLLSSALDIFPIKTTRDPK